MTNEEKAKFMVEKAKQFLTELNELMSKYGFTIETMINDKKEPLNDKEKAVIKFYKEQGGVSIIGGCNGAMLSNEIIPGYIVELRYNGTYEDKGE